MDSSQGISPVGGLIYLVFVVLEIYSLWIVFRKAGRPGWGAIIPLYNTYLLTTIAGKPGWWLILWCLPIVDIYILIVVMLGLAKSFGRGTGFAIGLIFLSPIFIPILAFGDNRYVGSGGQWGSRPATV